MVRRFFLILVAVFVGLNGMCLPAADQSAVEALEWKVLAPESVHPVVENFVGKLLSSMHYKKRTIDDALSSEMFDAYLDLLDGGRYYLLQADIDEFKQYRLQFDDAIKSGDLTGAFFIYNRFQDRLRSRYQFVDGLLKEDFDFTVDEYFDLDREDKNWAETEAELDEIWRKRVKHETLSLRVAGKEPADISETLSKRYDNSLRRVSQTESEDVFNLYLNALAETFDPHTGYMSPKVSDDFRIRISKSLEGIGATLQTEDEFTKVVEVVPGGPADKSGLLHPNDRIVGVGQGDEGEMVDVIGWRIDDVVELIRGPKDSKVRLQILQADASIYAEPEEIEIIRDKVKLSDRMAKSRIEEIDYQGAHFKIGIIEIPDFYFDYESQQKGDPDYPSTTRDVQKLLVSLKADSVDGIVIDLRQNGGGFLSEAIGLTGLFIKDGPVVQVRDSRGMITKNDDPDPRIYYEGPLAVVVDRLSASASEIFAAAIQDYGRGIVVGSPTFGKGTVQSIVSIDRYITEAEERLGQVRLTIAKFYRIGESDYKNALLWDQIAGTEFTSYSAPIRDLIPELTRKFEDRIQDDPEFRYLEEDIQELVKQRENALISLQEEKRKKEKEEAEALAKQREKERKEIGIEDEDLFLTETEHILGDYILMTRPEPVLASP
ncbi:MAG: carboxy terminal-processing peptidase [Acidobacteriota bacterium]